MKIPDKLKPLMKHWRPIGFLAGAGLLGIGIDMRIATIGLIGAGLIILCVSSAIIAWWKGERDEQA